VRIIKPSRVREFCRQYPDAAAGLIKWLKDAQRAEWRSLIDVRRLYASADGVKVRSGERERTATVFNIGGNKYRLIVTIHYNRQRIFVRQFLTHVEYDRGRWKVNL